MSFAFGFNEDDLSDDELLGTSSIPETPKVEQINALDNISSKIDENNMPVHHTLDSILSTLKDVRFTFDQYETTNGNIIFRRELFDVKHQLMSEDNDESEVTNSVLIGNNDVDLKKNVYEGGFKSWECSYDLIDSLAIQIHNNEFKGFNSILDLGCGTALPTSFLLRYQFMAKNTSPSTYILSDFNYDVLRLVTLPNILINWASTLSAEELKELTECEEGPMLSNEELLMTEKLLNRFRKELEELNIQLQFISGSWGNQFNRIVDKYSVDFILTSETIYAPETLPVVAESILDIFKNSKSLVSRAIVAAKTIYFGVGGSTTEFLNYINLRITSDFNISEETVNDSKLKRAIITIDYKKD